jgi:predicted RNA methylase
LDRFDTPTAIARRMVQLVSCKKVAAVADFAAGSGELIRHAQERWPSAVFLATDINQDIVSKLRRQHRDWSIGKCDFLSSRSKNLCAVTSELERVCVVLLNPPFSCRGARRLEVRFRGSIIRCSLALAFVFESLLSLRRGGQLVALLPAGTLTSDKDRNAWTLLNNLFEIAEFGINDRTTFDDCSAETVIIRITNRKLRTTNVICSKIPNHQLETKSNGLRYITIVRGKLPMYLTNGYSGSDYLPLVHTTELLKEAIDVTARRAQPSSSAISGPAVLLPRVGRPYKHKLKLYLSNERVVLSDCVIALRCKTARQARRLQSILLQNWDLLTAEYVGTCAKYVTVTSLQLLLESLGLQAVLYSSTATKSN